MGIRVKRAVEQRDAEGGPFPASVAAAVFTVLLEERQVVASVRRRLSAAAQSVDVVVETASGQKAIRVVKRARGRQPKRRLHHHRRYIRRHLQVERKR